MKKIITAIIFVSCALTTTETSSVYANVFDRETGYKNADQEQQKDDENVKRAQGDDSGRRSFHSNKAHWNEWKGGVPKKRVEPVTS